MTPRATLPGGIIPVGATHFYFDPARRTQVTNPWRRLDADGSWHMLRGNVWNQIVGTNRHKFFAIVDALQAPPGPLASESLTLRDYFAAKAMNGMYCDLQRPEMSYAECAKCAYEMADAMMEARQ